MTNTEAARSFEAIMAGLETPFYVVTAKAGGEHAGCLVGFATRCSIDPPRFGVWLSKLNHTYRIALQQDTLVVHVLRDGDRDLALLFGGQTGDDVDKFAEVDWHPGPGGCPVIDRLDWFAGTVVDRLDTGDHVAFLLAPSGGNCRRGDVRQLDYAEIGDTEAGHPVPER
jgi:flavin reductase (DIM6/NTAB) family NADH-FMN oxidoreductase RutF